MESERRNSFGSKESLENQRRNSKDNTEYVPTRCRITKPSPPKPATNPMQFVKTGPCGLYRQAQEQLKKVEEIKTTRPEIRDEAEEWQANLDNWKSSRRKRQEHIIERVVEVKKSEQQEVEKGRRKSKTFNEILEERNKRKNKYNIALYDDDDGDDEHSNLCDYGIGGNKQSNEENIEIIDNKIKDAKIEDSPPQKLQQTRTLTNAWNSSSNNINSKNDSSNSSSIGNSNNNNNNKEETESVQTEPEQYTYESAIQGYRTRVISKTNMKPSLPTVITDDNDKKSESSISTNTNIIDAASMPKESVLKRRELFENNNKMYELSHYESNTARRLCEDFAYSKSLKQRLHNLENRIYTDQSIVADNKDIRNNNNNNNNNSKDQSVRNRVSAINSLAVNSCSNINNNVVECENNNVRTDYANPKQQDCLTLVDNLEGQQYSSSEQLASSSQCGGDTDREDSGIHTADVSCSVSQADETVDEFDIVNPTDYQSNKICFNTNTNDDTTATIVPQTTNTKITNCSNSYLPENIIYPVNFLLEPRTSVLEPPKEKPPPPPPPTEDVLNTFDETESELKRLNSTKRIKNEIRIKRSSFLGIESDNHDQEIETTIQKPPDVTTFLQRESRLQKQLLYKQNQSSCSPSETGDSQDSGVELERGRLSSDTWCSSSSGSIKAAAHECQNSEACTRNSVTSEEDEIIKKEKEIIALVEQEEKWRVTNQHHHSPDLKKISQRTHSSSNQDVNLASNSMERIPKYVLCDDDDEHSDVLKVEHELQQLEREELQRKRENLLFNENRIRSQSARYLQNDRLSLEDIYRTSNQMLPKDEKCELSKSDYRKSLPELQNAAVTTTPPPKLLYDDGHRSRRPLQMSSSAPRSSHFMPHDNWIHSKLKPSATAAEKKEKFSYNQHWLIQEAEQRRISEQQQKQKLNNSLPQCSKNWKATARQEKHLPDSVIQTLTQRVHNKVSHSERNAHNRRMNFDDIANHYSPHSSSHSMGHALPIHHPHLLIEESQDKMLSVSGKKKCSYCGNELGRGAAMIIESLCLFYHMNCFKCCVCHIQLGDGLMGTDVRVRNNKLHCHNCYSSDDGVIFSCV